MCEETKVCVCLCLLALLLLSVLGVSHGQEQEQWHLITETELQSIEAYRRSCEAEKQSWLSQARTLRARAESLAAESASLNGQLRGQREVNQKLTRFFTEYESEQSRLLLRKDTRIAELEAESKAKGKAANRMAIFILVMGMAIILYAAAKLAGKFWRSK
jgi:chromosome segregation ATPase